MADLLELYDLAEQHQTPVYWFDLGAAESLSLQMEDGSCAIAMDPWRIPTLSDEKVKLAHELGHCETGAFYNRYAARDVRQKQMGIQKARPRGRAETRHSSGLP